MKLHYSLTICMYAAFRFFSFITKSYKITFIFIHFNAVFFIRITKRVPIMFAFLSFHDHYVLHLICPMPPPYALRFKHRRPPDPQNNREFNVH